MRVRRLVVALTGLLLAAHPLCGQVETRSLDTTFARLRAGPPGPAVALAVVRGGQIVYTNVAGLADMERAVAASVATRFDWASIAKQVTAFAVSQLVDEGLMATTDQVRRHLPELDLGGARITVADLLHHTAGIEDSDGLMALAGMQPGDPVTLQQLAGLLLRQQHVTAAPGERHAYSNGGYTLLALMVERLTGTGFARWTDSLIFAPIGMTRSGFLAAPDRMVPDRAMPYVFDRATGRWVHSVSESAPGAGGLFATVEDMARWAAHLMKPAYRAAATRRLREPGRLRSGEPLTYAWGLGLGNYRGVPTLSHSGSGPATVAYLVAFPEHDLAIVAAGAGETDPAAPALALRAADLFLAGKFPPPPPAAKGPRMLMVTEEMYSRRPDESVGVRVPAETLRQLAGTYRFPDDADDPPVVVRARGDQLEYSWGGRNPYMPLFPLPDGRFVAVPVWRVFRFLRDSSGAVTGVARERTAKTLLTSGPDRVVGARLPDRRFDEATAAPYVGHYYSEELGAWYEVGLRGDALELRHPRHGAMRLTPVDDNRFGIDGRLVATARFARHGDTVVGLELEAYSWSARSFFRRLPGSQASPAAVGRPGN